MSEVEEGASERGGRGNDPVKDYKGKLDSTGLVPAGIAPGKTKKDPPPVPAAGMPGSLENAPMKVEASELPKPAGGGGDVNKKGGLEALFASKAATIKKKPNTKQKSKEALEKLGLPEKKPIKPNGKMTHVFWNVVNPEKLEGTIWPELSDQNVKFNATELEELFGKKPQAEVMKKTKKENETLKPDMVKLIDSQRRQNVAIALRKLKLKNKEVRNALLTVDDAILNLQTVQVFLDTAPTPDELTLLQKYAKDGSDPKKLEAEEKYLFTLAEIPDLTDRLLCVKTKHTFKTDRSRVLTLIQIVKAAVHEVKSSQQLKIILEIVLAIGNYLNGGTTRGAAWGYKLDILPQLITIKDAVNNGTLMHYLYVLFERNYPDLIEFSLPECGKAISISLRDISNEMNSLAKNVQMLKAQLKKKSTLKGDNFSKVLTPFEVKASKEVSTMQDELEKVRTDFQNLAVKFAETGNDVEPKTFFPKLVEFEHGLKRAKLQIEDMRVAQERKKAVEDQKLERQTLMKLKKLVEATRGDNGEVNLGLIEAFKRSQNGRATEVVDRFMERYKQEQNRARRSVRKPRAQQRFLDA